MTPLKRLNGVARPLTEVTCELIGITEHRLSGISCYSAVARHVAQRYRRCAFQTLPSTGSSVVQKDQLYTDWLPSMPVDV